MADRPCPQCQYGLMHPRQSVYQTTLRGQLFSAPAMPAWQCDICGFHEFDVTAQAQIALITLDRTPAETTSDAPAERPPRTPPATPETDEKPPLRKFKR